MDDTILETERLRLRYQRKADEDFLIGLWTDPDTTRHTGGPRDRAFLEAEFAKASADPRAEEWDLWVLEEKEGGAPVGQAGFIPKTVAGEDFVELNYYLAPEARGRGYAREVAAGLLRRAFDEKGLRAVVAIIAPANESSRKVAEAVGMREWRRETRGDAPKLIYRIDAE